MRPLNKPGSGTNRGITCKINHATLGPALSSGSKKNWRKPVMATKLPIITRETKIQPPAERGGGLEEGSDGGEDCELVI